MLESGKEWRYDVHVEGRSEIAQTWKKLVFKERNAVNYLNYWSAVVELSVGLPCRRRLVDSHHRGRARMRSSLFEAEKSIFFEIYKKKS